MRGRVGLNAMSSPTPIHSICYLLGYRQTSRVKDLCRQTIFLSGTSSSLCPSALSEQHAASLAFPPFGYRGVNWNGCALQGCDRPTWVVQARGSILVPLFASAAAISKLVVNLFVIVRKMQFHCCLFSLQLWGDVADADKTMSTAKCSPPFGEMDLRLGLDVRRSQNCSSCVTCSLLIPVGIWQRTCAAGFWKLVLCAIVHLCNWSMQLVCVFDYSPRPQNSLGQTTSRAVRTAFCAQSHGRHRYMLWCTMQMWSCRDAFRGKAVIPPSHLDLPCQSQL